MFFARLYVSGKIYPGFRAKKDDLVIDLGCGDKPFWRADVYLDKSALGNEQRISSTGIEKDLGLYINGDIRKTPFKNKAFDFSYCSHVLEHVERPDLAIKEIMRISKNGYIVVPSGLLEMIFPHQSHLWFMFLKDKKLIFVRKSKSMHNALASTDTKYVNLIKFMKSPYIQLYWKKSIKYEVVDNLKPFDKFRATQDIRIVQLRYIQMLYLFLTKTLRFLFFENKGSESIMRTRIMD